MKINVGNIEIVLGDVFKLVLFLYDKILRILWEFGYIVDKYVICYELVFWNFFRWISFGYKISFKWLVCLLLVKFI